MKKKSLLWSLLALSVIALFSSCNKQSSPETVKFAVLSDIHYFDQSLFDDVPNAALEADLIGDRKLLKEGSVILESALDSIEASKPSFILISGDLTKDGEKLDHEKLAARFKQLSEKGIKVLVIPGNHDVYNPESMQYLHGTSSKIANVSDKEFAAIYKDCGYGDAVERDSTSLSYVSEPVKGIWVLGIDACQYKNNMKIGHEDTHGAISESTQKWIDRILVKAKDQHKQLITMMHHGMTEHFVGQSQLFPDYVIKDWQNISKEFADAGMKVIFTGHFHANDITKANATGNHFIFDVETGSAVTYPCYYRMVNFNTKDTTLAISSKRIENVTYKTIPSNTTFQQYGKKYIQDRLKVSSKKMLMKAPYQIPETVIKNYKLDSIMSNAFLAHYAGDEMPSASDKADITTVKKISPALGKAFESVWIDLPPKDNNVILDLKTGEAK
jgi:UDP-2,3-diacylglucosamine pyrophosphatase LpxH